MNRVVFNRRGRVRTAWRVLLYAGLFVLGGVASAVSLAFLGLGGVGLSADSLPAYVLLCLSALVPGLLIVALVDGQRRRPAAALGVSVHDRVGVELFQGTVVGFLIVLAVWLVMAVSGMVEVGVGAVAPFDLVTVFVVLVLAAAFEELFFRGYLLSVMIDGGGFVTGVVITSLMFAIAHNSNPGATSLSFVNTTLAGVLLCVAYIRSRSLWLPTALHVSWNLTLGVVLGLPVSGIALSERFLESDLTERGRAAELLTGGDYGSEGGLLLTSAALLATAWLWRTPRIRPSAELQPIWLWRVSRETEPGPEKEPEPEEQSAPFGEDPSGEV